MSGVIINEMWRGDICRVIVIDYYGGKAFGAPKTYAFELYRPHKGKWILLMGRDSLKQLEKDLPELRENEKLWEVIKDDVFRFSLWLSRRCKS